MSSSGEVHPYLNQRPIYKSSAYFFSPLHSSVSSLYDYVQTLIQVEFAATDNICKPLLYANYFVNTVSE